MEAKRGCWLYLSLQKKRWTLDMSLSASERVERTEVHSSRHSVSWALRLCALGTPVFLHVQKFCLWCTLLTRAHRMRNDIQRTCSSCSPVFCFSCVCPSSSWELLALFPWAWEERRAWSCDGLIFLFFWPFSFMNTILLTFCNFFCSKASTSSTLQSVITNMYSECS